MSVSKSTLYLSILFSSALTLAVTNYLYSTTSTLSSTNSQVAKKDEEFFLLVNLEFADSQALAVFREAFKPLSAYVLSQEKGTLVYEVLYSDQDSNKVLIFEKYINKDYYLNVHKTSEPFLTFRPILAKLTEEGKVKVDGSSYTY